MPTFSFYDPSSGILASSWYCGPDDGLQLNTPAGMVAIEGQHDPRRVRVNIKTKELEPYQPPAPANTEWATHRWDADAWAWVADPTDAALARDARVERDRRLAATDWVVARAMERGEPVPADWVGYREHLRDVPEQPGFPRVITWPTPPNHTP